MRRRRRYLTLLLQPVRGVRFYNSQVLRAKLQQPRRWLLRTDLLRRWAAPTRRVGRRRTHYTTLLHLNPLNVRFGAVRQITRRNPRFQRRRFRFEDHSLQVARTVIYRKLRSLQLYAKQRTAARPLTQFSFAPLVGGFHRWTRPTLGITSAAPLAGLLYSRRNLPFILPAYGTLFLTNTHHYLAAPGSVAIKASLYSFTYYRDIKEFFLRKYIPTSTLPTYDRPYSRVSVGSLPTGGGADVGNWPFSRTALRGSNFRVKPTRFLFRMNRVRFKPGYSRIWRLARASLKLLLGLSFRYQKKLTKYVMRFYRFHRLALLQAYELRASTTLLYAALTPESTKVRMFFEAGLVYVNGLRCTNADMILRTNDTLQVVITYKYYTL